MDCTSVRRMRFGMRYDNDQKHVNSLKTQDLNLVQHQPPCCAFARPTYLSKKDVLAWTTSMKRQLGRTGVALLTQTTCVLSSTTQIASGRLYRGDIGRDLNDLTKYYHRAH